jgi:hypothetical protein
MGFAPPEFYRLRYSELVLILEGYRARHKREMRQRREENAWVVSWLLLPYKGKDTDPLTPDQLMGKKPRGKRESRQKFADAGSSAQAFFEAREAKQKELTDGR